MRNKKSVLFLLTFFFMAGGAGMNLHAAENVLSFQALDIDGKEVNLADFSGKTLLVVNTASKCGFTPQYASLQKVYEKYQAQGFEVLAFPANDFGKQEPGTNAEIKEFCNLRFNITFPLFSKVVVKGEDKHPLFKYLTEDSNFKGPIQWNFTKFLVNAEGNVVARFASGDDPMSPEVTAKIEETLNA